MTQTVTHAAKHTEILMSRNNNILSGDPTVPILYHVDRIRDGKSFTVRSVKATQRNQTILTMQVSYHKEEIGPFEYQFTMPQVPKPEDVPTTRERLQEFLE